MKMFATKVNPAFKIAQQLPLCPVNIAVAKAVPATVNARAFLPQETVASESFPTHTHHATALPTTRLCR